MRKTVLGVFYLLAALVLGALIADGASQVGWLSWLSYGKSIGLSVAQPMVLDLSVLKIAFGIEFGATVAHVLCLVAAFLAYRATVKKMGLTEGKEKKDTSSGNQETETSQMGNQESTEKKDEKTTL